MKPVKWVRINNEIVTQIPVVSFADALQAVPVFLVWNIVWS